MTATSVPFSPRPGSIGQRAIEHLTLRGRTSLIDLSDALDADTAALVTSLQLCVRHGLIDREDADGKVHFVVPPQVGELPADRINSEHGPVEDSLPNFSWPAHRCEAFIPKPKPPKGDERHFEFGLFSDGRLVIELDETVTTLTRSETERLFKFMQGIEGALHAAA